MKQIYLTFLALVISSTIFGQAKRYPMFEHFTQASCGPCASQNPAFQALYFSQKYNGHHVAYHTSWPGVDPMHALNPSEVASMVTLYNVSGVPDMIFNGTSIGSPTAVTEAMFTQAGTSPIRINTTYEEYTADSGKVNINIEVIVDVPAGNYILRAIALEKEIIYATPPGSNGEKEFPNVFRKFVNPKGFPGENIIFPAKGEVISLSYTFPYNAAWNKDDLYVLAYIQNTATKEIIQSGSSEDYKLEIASKEESYINKSNVGETTDNEFFIANTSTETKTFTFELTTNYPADWSNTVTLDDVEYTAGEEIEILPGQTLEGALYIKAGTTKGMGRATVVFTEVNQTIKQSISSLVLNGVTDLLVFGEYSNVDIKGSAQTGLELAGETALAYLNRYELDNASRTTALDDIQNVYLNLGWTFPAVSTDMMSFVTKLTERGGNVMLAGQDLGWDMASGQTSSNGNATTKAFYENIFGSKFVNDGGTTNTSFSSITGETIFGNVLQSNISKPYGATYFYPDEMTAIDATATNIFKYASTRFGGVRSVGRDYKFVNLGIGLEMIGNTAIRDEITGIIYKWFHGQISGTQFDNKLNALIGQAYPNPASSAFTLEFNQPSQESMQLEIRNIVGNLVMKLDVNVGQDKIDINTSQLSSGTYLYRLTNDKKISQSGKIQVSH